MVVMMQNKKLIEEGDPLTLIKEGKTVSIPFEFKNLQQFMSSLISNIKQYQPGGS